MSRDSIKQQMSDGFIKGFAGKEEDTSQARKLDSTEPLPNEMIGIKKLYIVCFIAMGIGLFYTPSFAIGILGLMVVYCIDSSMVDHKRDRLRRAKFKFTVDVDDERLFEIMQPVFISKYKMLVEKRDDGAMTLTHNGYSYDILLQKDDTFVLWWRESGIKALVPKNKYKSYCEILTAIGIIAYEIQNTFNV